MKLIRNECSSCDLGIEDLRISYISIIIRRWWEEKVHECSNSENEKNFK